MNQEPDRSPFAAAMEWTSRITTISIEMVLPALLGYWLDSKLGTRVVFVILGAMAGMVLGIWHLLRMTSPAAAKSPPGRPAKGPDDRPPPGKSAQ